MGNALKLVLENKNGERVRTLGCEAETLTLIHRKDSRRLEAISDLSELDEQGIEYVILKVVEKSQVTVNGMLIPHVGRIRLESNHDIFPGDYDLAKDDSAETMSWSLKRTAVAHLVIFLFMFGLSWITKPNELTIQNQVLTVVVPQKTVQEIKKSIKVSQEKIIQKNIPKHAKVVNYQVKKPMKLVHNQHLKNTRHNKMSQKNRHSFYSENAKPTMNHIGALGALGGLKNGTRGFEGLDASSLKNIRGAGVGSGGGGVGSGAGGGIRAVLPGSGLVAGSAGSGGRAEGAGGYGTRGVGGGRAGYGTVRLVGSPAGITMPVDEEALVQGGLDKDQIAAVINKNMGQIVYCYEQGLQVKPELTGRVSVKFAINGLGHIFKANVAESSLHYSKVESCMIAKMRAWKFPHPIGNVNVDVLYPFDLRRVSQN